MPGFAGSELLMDGDRITGIRTGDKGVGKNGVPKGNYEPGIDIRAKITILAEGARGSLTKQLIQNLHLDAGRNPQVYAVGVKEVWDVPKQKTTPGWVIHTMGWPLRNEEFGGGFIYNMDGGKVSIGLVIGLDYPDPHVDPHHAVSAIQDASVRARSSRGRRPAFLWSKGDSRRRILGPAAVLLQRAV